MLTNFEINQLDNAQTNAGKIAAWWWFHSYFSHDKNQTQLTTL